MLRLRDMQLEKGEPKEDLWETILKENGVSLEVGYVPSIKSVASLI